MNISGVVIYAQPERSKSVESRLCMIPGVEVHAVTDDGRMVVTIENDMQETIDTVTLLHDIEGVLSASMIYNHFLEPEELES